MSKTDIVLADLTSDIIQEWKQDEFNALLNRTPPKKWLQVHPYIKNYVYIPIDKIEYLLRKIFKRYRIEITGQGTAFNGVWVTVRVHFFHPILQDWDFHDGIGACQMQTKSGQSPADLANINNGALSMAFPIAKTVAVKDACDHFGELFGANLNRTDTIPYEKDANLTDKVEQRVREILQACETKEEVESASIPEGYENLVNERLEEIKNEEN